MNIDNLTQTTCAICDITTVYDDIYEIQNKIAMTIRLEGLTFQKRIISTPKSKLIYFVSKTGYDESISALEDLSLQYPSITISVTSFEILEIRAGESHLTHPQSINRVYFNSQLDTLERYLRS